jgi:large subunit ribosomal protein L15
MPLHMRRAEAARVQEPVPRRVPGGQPVPAGELFPEGGAVDVDDLVAAGAVRAGQPVKILGNGEITVAVQVTADAFSASAKDKIAAAGGSTTER